MRPPAGLSSLQLGRADEKRTLPKRALTHRAKAGRIRRGRNLKLAVAVRANPKRRRQSNKRFYRLVALTWSAEAKPRHQNSVCEGNCRALVMTSGIELLHGRRNFYQAITTVGSHQSNNKMVTVPIGAGSLMGSIARIAELVKELAARDDGLNHDRLNGRLFLYFWLDLSRLLLAARVFERNGYLLWAACAVKLSTFVESGWCRWG